MKSYRRYGKGRVRHGFDLDVGVSDRLKLASEKSGLTMGWLVHHALDEFLCRYENEGVEVTSSEEKNGSGVEKSSDDNEDEDEDDGGGEVPEKDDGSSDSSKFDGPRDKEGYPLDENGDRMPF